MNISARAGGDSLVDTHSTTKRETGTLGKALSVLEIIAGSDRPLRFTEILKQSDQPRGTLHRQISNLVEEGMLTVNHDLTYAIGVRLLGFAAKAWSGNEFRLVAEPHLRALHELTNETVHLGILRGPQIFYLDKVESKQGVRMHSQIGNASPVYCTGVGKAALSTMNDAEIDQLIGGLLFRRYTPTTLTDAAALRAEILAIRRDGYGFDREEHETGIHCVSAPVWADAPTLHAAISVTAPVYRVPMEKLEQWKGAVCETARSIMDDMRTKMGPRR